MPTVRPVKGKIKKKPVKKSTASVNKLDPSSFLSYLKNPFGVIKANVYLLRPFKYSDRITLPKNTVFWFKTTEVIGSHIYCVLRLHLTPSNPVSSLKRNASQLEIDSLKQELKDIVTKDLKIRADQLSRPYALEWLAGSETPTFIRKSWANNYVTPSLQNNFEITINDGKLKLETSAEQLSGHSKVYVSFVELDNANIFMKAHKQEKGSQFTLETGKFTSNRLPYHNIQNATFCGNTKTYLIPELDQTAVYYKLTVFK